MNVVGEVITSVWSRMHRKQSTIGGCGPKSGELPSIALREAPPSQRLSHAPPEIGIAIIPLSSIARNAIRSTTRFLQQSKLPLHIY